MTQACKNLFRPWVKSVSEEGEKADVEKEDAEGNEERERKVENEGEAGGEGGCGGKSNSCCIARHPKEAIQPCQ